jgi:14-3-3 protein epsilon
MQLLRDNLTLWTSSDGGEAEPAAAAGGAEASKDEKSAESKPDAATESKDEKTEDAPAAS